VSDIFVSYAKEDRDRVEPLARALASHGWDVFWDRAIPTGKTWREVIGAKLNAARCIVVVWSRSSIDSDWVQEEADVGRERRILAPVLIDDVKPPLGFRAVQAANLSGWDGAATAPALAQLLTDIGKIQEREVRRTPEPIVAPAATAGATAAKHRVDREIEEAKAGRKISSVYIHGFRNLRRQWLWLLGGAAIILVVSVGFIWPTPTQTPSNPATSDPIVLDGKLMWTRTDNGREIGWNGANQYCKELTLYALSDWRLPTLSQLEKLYDGKRRNIRKPFRLTSPGVWSSDTQEKLGSSWAFLFAFDEGKHYVNPQSDFSFKALCVRGSEE
jgi:hypothetical protein